MGTMGWNFYPITTHRDGVFFTDFFPMVWPTPVRTARRTAAPSMGLPAAVSPSAKQPNAISASCAKIYLKRATSRRALRSGACKAKSKCRQRFWYTEKVPVQNANIGSCILFFHSYSKFFVHKIWLVNALHCSSKAPVCRQQISFLHRTEAVAKPISQST